MLLTQFLSYQRYLLLKDDNLRELSAQANLTKEKLQTVMTNNYSATQTLAFITEKNGVPRDFDSVGKKLLLFNKYVDVVEVVTGSVITHIYPLKGNEPALGYNILSDSSRNSGALKAIETGKFFMAGPIPLKQGGVAIIGRQPIFINNKFWGFSASLTSLATLLHAADIDSAGRGNIMYQIAKVNALTGKEEFFLPEKPGYDKGLSVPIDVPNGEWKLYVFAHKNVPLYPVITFSLLGFILSLTGGLLAWFISGQPEKLRNLVQQKVMEIESEQKLSDSIINSLPGVFYMAGVDGKLLRWNKNFELVTGYSHAEITRMRVIDFVDMNEKEGMLQKKQLAINNGMADTEAFLLTKTGQKVPYYFTSLFINNNQKPYLLGVGIDITERKKAELKLTESEFKYRSIIEQATDAICIADSDYNLLDVNSSACRMFGYNREEFLKLPFKSVLFEEELAGVETRKEYLKRVKAVTSERRFKRRDGVALELEVNANLLEDGRVLIFARDISERKKAEFALAESEEQYRSLIENSADIIMRLDLNENILFINYAGGGYTKEQIVGSSAYNFVMPEFHDLVRATHKKVMAERTIERYETMTLGMDGVKRWFQTNVGPIIIKDKVTGITLITRDITEAKNVEAAIIREKTLSDSLINSLPGVFYLYDDTGQFIRWNKNFETVTGYTAQELPLMHPLDFFKGDNKLLLQERITEVFEKGHSEVETLFRNKAGVEIPYYFNGLAITYEGKRCLIGVGIDITARKSAEAKLQESEKRFRETLDNMLEGVQIFDAGYRCLYANKAVGILGPYTVEQTLGRTLFENFPGIEKTDLFKIFEQCRKNNESKHIEYWFPSVRNNDGRWFELSIQPNPLGLFVLSVEITERKAAERDLLKMNTAIKKRATELNCLYTVSEIVNRQETIEDIVRECLKVIPSAYQFPDIVYARITIGITEYTTNNFAETEWAQVEDITIGGQTSGKLEVFYAEARGVEDEGPFLKEERELLKSVAAMLGNAAERKRAALEIKQSQIELRQLSAHLQAVREEERSNIAREIHDELGQQLTGLKMDTSWLGKKLPAGDTVLHEKLEGMLALIDDTVKTVRRISSELRPGILDDMGLIAALEWQSSEFEKRSGITCRFSTNLNELPVSHDIATGIFRVYQETLTNIARHSNAKLVRARLEINAHNILLNIIDDGDGFNMQEARLKKTLGIVGMKERAIMLGGQLTITTEKGVGTAVVLRIPIG